ncbi:hypothetical protein QR680_003693 [Steinernema hermaphroditum]|uniref:Uncharacterized protein n=1 Tax=Steinernema hermaphroditum TaxID=289476 RepID=A0AA39HNF5_9BILA|nr:hypothetical protein QR680_003693 [Steinernema hermaphroditum]
MVTTLAVLVGMAYFVVALFMFVLNGLLLLTLLRNKEFSSSSYRICKSICIACMAQLLVLGLAGIMTMAQSTFHYYIDRVLGIILQSTWYHYIALNFTLAVDRLLIFMCPRSFDISKITYVFLGLSYLIWISIAVLMSFPGFGETYERNGEFFAWCYSKGDGSRILSTIEPYYDLITDGVVLAIYLVVTGSLVKLKKSSTQSASFKTEIRILVVSVVSFLCETLTLAAAFWGPLNKSDRITLIIINMLWIVICGMFATLTLVVNGALRRRMVDVLVRKNNSVAVITMPNHVFE